MHRRDFLRAGAVPFLGIGEPGVSQKSCILLMLTGGPSHLDTLDMKPDAPMEIRGPFRPIRTNVPGIEISEIFPRMARQAHRFSLIRSVHHSASNHRAALRTMLAGLSAGRTSRSPAGAPIGPHREPELLHAKYGWNSFGQRCLEARQLIESGVRFVTVNMFDSVFDEVTWDTHGWRPFSPISVYRDVVGPIYDMAYTALLDDLSDRGLLASTIVVSMGEFGRTPKINPSGGRDHWPHCFTIQIAGGGIRGGEVCGSSDVTGSEPRDHPVAAARIAATIHRTLGIPLQFGAEPLHELSCS